jgi:glycosyltransferase involved in cell wall biosynthesis
VVGFLMMSTKGKISVIMPAYNAEKFIVRAIESILQQTYTDLELLIADDGSKDSTKKIVDAIADPRVKCFHNEKNLGYLKTCNKLFALATGDFIAFQDADDFSDLTRLEKQMDEFRKDPKLGACGTNLTAVHENGTAMFCSNYLCDHDSIKSELLKGNYSMIPNSFVFKREIFDTVGMYNEYWDRIGAEDFYWAWLIMEKYKLINIYLPLYYYRHNPNSICGDWSDNRRKMHNAQLLKYLFKTRAETGSDPIEKKDWETLDRLIATYDAPYLQDTSLYYRELAKRDFYSGNKKRALELTWRAIKNAPLKTTNYRDFFYYLRTDTEQTVY